MTIHFEVLGEPGRDNALYVTIDTGQSVHRLLFDCGDGVLDLVSLSDIQHVEALFFSHFHFDHIAGFDFFFRLNWYRHENPVNILGPAETQRVIPHRLQGVTWNLVEGLSGEIHVASLDGDEVHTATYHVQDGFQQPRKRRSEPFTGVIYRSDAFEVVAVPLPHGTTSLGYIVREFDKKNVDMHALEAKGMKPGPWLQAVKDAHRPDAETIETQDGMKTLGELRDAILVTQAGDSIAYLTDFYLDNPSTKERLTTQLKNCRVLVCENNYADADRELAVKNFHMTSSDVGQLAAEIQPEQLILFHLSDRYTQPQWQGQLHEVRQHFPKAQFPKRWAERFALSSEDER